MKEIIVDNFAGGGGASTGIEMATGRSVDIAINHDPNAIAMHTTNHPDTLHYCESVFDIKPKDATAGKPVALAWFSPDCRHFSKAKGSTPVKKEIRGLAWIAVRWALDVYPRVVMLENVSEFQTWGPLLAAEERPDPERAGETFKAFVDMLSNGIHPEHPALDEACAFLEIDRHGPDAMRLVNGLGYAVEYRELRACDYGSPTIRKRFFMVMRRDGKPIVWPEASHGDPKSLQVQAGLQRPWRTTAECIDWSIACPSIFERTKPLARNTLKRIARGIQRSVVENPTPVSVRCKHTTSKGSYDSFSGQSLGAPLQTITKKHGYALVTPHLTKFRTGATGQEVTEPMPTVTAGSSERPGGNGHALGIVEAQLAPYIARQFGQSIGHGIDQPAGTITAGGSGKSVLVSPTLIQVGYGERPGQAPRVPGIFKPLGTVVAGGGKHALVSTFLAKHFGGNYSGPGVSMDEPMHTVTVADHHALVTANLMVNTSGHSGGAADAPAPTLTTGNQQALVTSSVIKFRGTNIGQPTDSPLHTITASGTHLGELRTHLAVDDYDHERADLVSEFLKSHGMSAFVDMAGESYRIVDIGMRMLQPPELYAAQGFPEWYVIDRDYLGNVYAKDKQVARCGNAVPPQFSEALTRANLPELCVEDKTRHSAA